MNTQHSSTLTLPRLLRGVGVALLIIGAGTFLVEGWHVLTAVNRYLGFLGITTVLALLGLLCGTVIHEPKGARTLLALAAASLTAHFAQLGNAILTAVQSGSGVVESFTGPLPIAVVALGAIALGTPFALLGFAALQREGGKRLGMVFLALNAVALLPVRTGYPAMGLMVAAAVVRLLVESVLRNYKCAPTTTEGQAVRWLLNAPVLLLLGRFALHSHGVTDFGIIALMLAVVMGKMTPGRPNHQLAWQALSVPVFSIGALLFAVGVGSPNTFFNNGDWFFASVLPSLLVLFYSVFLSGGAERFARTVVGLFQCVITFVGVFGAYGPVGTVLPLITSVVLMVMAFQFRDRMLLGVSTAQLGLILARQVVGSFHWWWQTPWLSLAAIGVGVLVLAIVIEKYGPQVRARFQAVRGRLSDWN